jgi:transcriptional regulator with XRE-family HTH domain
MAIGSQMRAIRLIHGKTIDEWVSILGNDSVSVSSVSRIESEKQQPSADFMTLFCDKIHVNPEVFGMNKPDPAGVE